MTKSEINFYKADGTPLALGGHATLVPNGDRWSTTLSFDSPEDQAYRQLGEVFDLQLTGTYTTREGVLVQQEDSLFYENEFAIRNLPQVPLQGAKVTYNGTITAKETGDYRFIQYYAGFQSTSIGGQERNLSGHVGKTPIPAYLCR